MTFISRLSLLLAGSRLQEIKDNLPAMIEVAERFEDYQMVLAGAPSVEDEYYEKFIEGTPVRVGEKQDLSALGS